jgi:hypothetical protein
MTAASEKSLGETLNTWVQTIGIVCAGVWAAYTFVYKDILVPRSAPVDVSVTLELKKIGPKSTSDQGPGLIAVQMIATATNPSPRETQLVTSVWIADACTIASSKDVEGFDKRGEDALNGITDNSEMQFAKTGNCSIAGLGRAFHDTHLNANETVRSTKIFYVPVDRFDEVDVGVAVASADRPDDISWQWKIENDSIKSVISRVGKNGQLTEFKKDKDGRYSEKDFTEFGLKRAGSFASLSLWQ